MKKIKKEKLNTNFQSNLKSSIDNKDIKSSIENSDVKKPLKIALFIDTYYPMIDGVVLVVDNYAKILSKFADVAVFCPKPDDKKYKDNFSYKVVRSKKISVFFLDYNLGIPQFDKKFKQAIINFNPDIIHIHSPFNIGKMGAKMAKKLNIPLVSTLHSQFKQDFYRATKNKWLTNKLLAKTMKVFNQCDECWAVNDSIKELYENDYGLKAPCKVQQNATDVKPIENLDFAKQRMKELFNIKENENLFLFVGRINALKNIFFIVQSLKIVKDKGLPFKMLFIGSGQDIEKLKEEVKKLNLENEIIIAGRVEDRNDVILAYARADLFLFPSLYDANSLVQIEAATQKTPTLFIRGSKTSSTVEEDVSGFMANNNVEDYANKIISIMNNKDYYNKVAQGAFDNLYKNWEDVVNIAYKDYLKLIKDKKNKNKI